jgi:hypothetical protein
MFLLTRTHTPSDKIYRQISKRNQMKTKYYSEGTIPKSKRINRRKMQNRYPSTQIRWLLTFLDWYRHFKKMWRGLNIYRTKAVSRSVDVITTHKPSYTITNITPTMNQHVGNKPEATNIGKSTLNFICRWLYSTTLTGNMNSLLHDCISSP